MSDHMGTLQKRTIFVNGYATADITQEQMRQWANDLTYVSCYSYGFKIDGELIPVSDENLIRYASESGVAPLLVITPVNESGTYSYELLRTIFNNPRIRDRFINNIFLTVIEKNYYGAIFNFGYIATEDRDQFVITVSKTAARLNRMGAAVIVSLITGMNDAGIDYVSLNRAANFIELRTFLWEQQQGPPAAISPIDLIRNILAAYALRIDAGKILLGLPNYGYDWPLPFVQGKTIAETISNKEAAERAARMGAAIEYSDIVQAAYYNYTDAAGVRHVVWFDDARGIRARLELVNSYNLAGVSIWTIMNPFPAGIEAINEMFAVFKI